MIPRAFIGSASGGGIYALNQGHKDGGADVNLRAVSNPIAPAGVDWDHSFNRVWITVTWSMSVTLLVTPIVDNVELADAAFSIVLAAGPTDQRRSQVFERPLYIPFKRAGLTKYRRILRGTWFALRVESDGGLGSGDVILDSVELDFDPLAPTKEIVG
jgi:hypothetical protein